MTQPAREGEHLPQAHGDSPALEGIHELPGCMPAVDGVKDLASKTLVLVHRILDCHTCPVLLSLGLPHLAAAFKHEGQHLLIDQTQFRASVNQPVCS